MRVAKTSITLAGLLLAGLAFGAAADRAEAQYYGYFSYYSAPAVVLAPPPLVVAPPPAWVVPSGVYCAPSYPVYGPAYSYYGGYGGGYYRSYRYCGQNVYRSHHGSYRSYSGHGGGPGFGFGTRVHH